MAWCRDCLGPVRNRTRQACCQYRHRLAARSSGGVAGYPPPRDQRRWQTSVFPWVVQNPRETVIDFLAALADAHAHKAVTVRQFLADGDDLIDRADRAEAPPCPDEACRLR